MKYYGSAAKAMCDKKVQKDLIVHCYDQYGEDESQKAPGPKALGLDKI